MIGVGSGVSAWLEVRIIARGAMPTSLPIRIPPALCK